MNNTTFDNSILSEIPGGVSVIPNALIGFLSSDSLVVLQKIYQNQFFSNCELYGDKLWTKISTSELEFILKKNRRDVMTILKELISLGLILCFKKNRNNVFYTINWSEIIVDCDILCRIDTVEKCALYNICVDSQFSPISKIKKSTIDNILEEHKSVEQYNSIVGTTPVGSTMERTTPVGSTMERTTPVGSTMERTTPDSFKNQTNLEDTNEEDDETEYDFRCDPYQKYVDYFNSRDLNLYRLSTQLCDEFTGSELSDDDDDVVKSIKVVWQQLDYNDEDYHNNYIDIQTFYNILYHSWKQLKEDYSDYSLTEEEMKNIFAFIMMEVNGEQCLYIDPHKLQDVKYVPRKRTGDSKKNYKYSDRMSRSLFVECIEEIAEKNSDLLTSAEIVAMMLIERAKISQNKAFSERLPRRAYEVLIEKFSCDSGVNLEDVKYLLKDLPQKGSVTIAPQQLIPDKFFQYNHEHNEESVVEKLLDEKLLEEESKYAEDFDDDEEGVDIDEGED